MIFENLCIFDWTNWTFNLPDFQGRYLKQGTSGTYGSESLPNIKGGIGCGNFSKKSHTSSCTINDINTSGVFIGTATSNNSHITDATGASWFLNGNVGLNASLYSSTYQDNAKVNPDNAEIMYCIKY